MSVGRPTEEELLAIANAAASAAGVELLASFGGELEDLRTKSTPTDPVSATDLAAEAAIRRVLTRERPHDSILGEEGGLAEGDDELRWVVDPLDGTVNFIYGIPTFSVSIACEDGDGALVGVVLDPVREERFEATRSGPAKLNGRSIRASRCDELASALVGTGFAYGAAIRQQQAHVLDGLLGRVRDIRRAGSAALDLCSCECGRLDAYFERDVNRWDVAAGELICARAGLEIRWLEASASLPAGIAVAPPALIDALYELVATP